eukprot:m.222009 g.222009  ORF g.222009 m.222009 type:complete len:384 (-) comp19193_c0_seq14:2669-3820(-)
MERTHPHCCCNATGPAIQRGGHFHHPKKDTSLGPLQNSVLHFPEIYDKLVTSSAANRALGKSIMNALLQPFLMSHELDREMQFDRQLRGKAGRQTMTGGHAIYMATAHMLLILWAIQTKVGHKIGFILFNGETKKHYEWAGKMMTEQVERLVRAVFPQAESSWKVAVPATCTDGASQVHAGFCKGLGPERCKKWLYKIDGWVVVHPSWMRTQEVVPEDSPFAKNFDQLQQTCFNIQCAVHVQKNFFGCLVPSVTISVASGSGVTENKTIKIDASHRNQLRKAFYRVARITLPAPRRTAQAVLRQAVVEIYHGESSMTAFEAEYGSLSSRPFWGAMYIPPVSSMDNNAVEKGQVRATCGLCKHMHWCSRTTLIMNFRSYTSKVC